MKRILLTTTSLVLAAGVASAETSITWSGAATAGIARDGATQAGAAVVQSAAGLVGQKAAIVDANDTKKSASTNTNSITVALDYLIQTIDDAEILIDAAAASVSTHTGTTAAEVAADLVTIRAEMALLRSGAVADLANAGGAKTLAGLAAQKTIDAIDDAAALLDAVHGTPATAKGTAGDFQSYSEVNATVTGSVSTDNGITITAAVSVDAGTGYDFADDDAFDATKTNGVSLDNVTIATAMGTFKIDENAITHLVDGDDDAAADIMYTNTFGAASVSVAIDANKDTDLAARKASTLVGWTVGADGSDSTTTGTDGVSTVTRTAARAADVAWSAKVSMPVAGGTAYVAMDEEGGNIFGASTTLGGVGISFSSKLEALEEELSIDRSNTIGLSYAMGATTLGASWNSVEDGDQWGISAAYSADGMSLSASTDEGSDWSVSGSYAMGAGASIVGGMNYTEDAYLGLSFAF